MRPVGCCRTLNRFFGMQWQLGSPNRTQLLRSALKILRQRVTANFAGVDASELPTLLKRVDIYDGSHFVRLALQMVALVFVRTGELIPAQWSEFDRKEKLWSIPVSG